MAGATVRVGASDRHSSSNIPTGRSEPSRLRHCHEGDTVADVTDTLRGFGRFLEQYRGLLGALPSGVIYVSPAPWSGPVQRVFDKVIHGGEVQGGDASAFRDYCQLRARIEAKEWAALSVANLQRYRVLEGVFQTSTFDTLYRCWRQVPDTSVSCDELATARRLDCALRIHVLGDRYGVTRRTKASRQG